MTNQIYMGFKARDYAEQFERFLTQEHKAELFHSVRTGKEVIDLYRLPQDCRITYFWGIDRAGGDTKVFFTGNDSVLASLVQHELRDEPVRNEPRGA